MDAESPIHLERLRARPEIKAALLRFDPFEARFERSEKNTLYWPPIQVISDRFLAAGCSAEVREDIEVYGRPCWLLATALTPSPESAYAIAVAGAEHAPADTLLDLLRDVTHDYWYGSYFWK